MKSVRVALFYFTRYSTLSTKAISENMAEKMPTARRTIERDIAKLKKMGILVRKGGRKEGRWEVEQ